MKIPSMKKLLMMVACVITFGCQNDVQLEPQPDKRVTHQVNHVQADARIGTHPYWYYYRSESTSQMRYAYSDDGLTWNGNQFLNSSVVLGSSTSPCPVEFNAKAYLFYKGGSTSNLYFSTSTDGITWTPNTQIPSVTTGYSPYAIVYNNSIYVFFIDPSNKIYFVYSSNGTTWSAPKSIYQTNSSFNDTSLGGLFVMISPTSNNKLDLYYSATSSPAGELRVRTGYLDSSGQLTFGAYDFFVYRATPTTYTGVNTTTGVSVVAQGGYKYIAYKDSNSDSKLNIFKQDIYESTDGTVTWTNASTSNAPSMVFYNGKFTMVYKSLSSGAILRSTSTDGQTWANGTGIGQTTNGGPRLTAN